MFKKQIIRAAALGACLMAAGTVGAQVANTGSAGSASTASSGPVQGVVAQVKGGRVTVRLDDGRVQTFSVAAGTLAPGDRFRAQQHQAGDAQRLEQVQKQN